MISLASLDQQIDTLSQSLHSAPYARQPSYKGMSTEPLNQSEHGASNTSVRRKGSYMESTRSSNYKMPDSFTK